MLWSTTQDSDVAPSFPDYGCAAYSGIKKNNTKYDMISIPNYPSAFISGVNFASTVLVKDLRRICGIVLTRYKSL